MHNDGVAQGLSEMSAMRDVRRRGVLTVGTGPGNARVTSRKKENRTDRKSGETKDAGDKDREGRDRAALAVRRSRRRR